MIRAGLFVIVPLAGLTACAGGMAFDGRLVLQAETPAQMAADERCQHAWDVKPGQHATACSWTFKDPLNPGHLACHISYMTINGAAGLAEELSNCAGIDQTFDNG